MTQNVTTCFCNFLLDISCIAFSFEWKMEKTYLWRRVSLGKACYCHSGRLKRVNTKITKTKFRYGLLNQNSQYIRFPNILVLTQKNGPHIFSQLQNVFFFEKFHFSSLDIGEIFSCRIQKSYLLLCCYLSSKRSLTEWFHFLQDSAKLLCCLKVLKLMDTDIR